MISPDEKVALCNSLLWAGGKCLTSNRWRHKTTCSILYRAVRGFVRHFFKHAHFADTDTKARRIGGGVLQFCMWLVVLLNIITVTVLLLCVSLCT
jgi:hypothetical protein